MSQSAKPLSGTNVLDLTNVLSGPFCCHQLAHMGANVIKVERPGRGDLARQLGSDPNLSSKNMGISFLAQNAGKKSITLNFKHPEGRRILIRLIEKTDVLVENFRPGVMNRLELGYEQLKKANPELVYCAISGFGQSGAMSGSPAYDQIIQGYSGVMSITGGSDSAPLRVGYPIADTIGGLTAAFAIASALQAKPRGCMIDVSMLESIFSTMGWVLSNYLIGGTIPEPHGNENTTSAPSGTFQTADGLMNIAANKDDQWTALAKTLGREDLLECPEYGTREMRKANRSALRTELEKSLKENTSRHWVRELNSQGVPAGEILSVPDAVEKLQDEEQGFIGKFASVPGAGCDISVVRTGFRIDGESPSVDEPPPELGAHNREVFRELGLSDDYLKTLESEGVV